MEIKTWLSIFKWINIVAALVIGAMGIYQLVTLQQFKDFNFWQIWSFFNPVYMIIFCMMLLAIEFKGDLIKEYFKFIMSFMGRGIFYIFLGSVASYQPLAYKQGNTAAWAWGLVLWIVGVFYIVMNFAAPDGAIGEIKQAVEEKYGTA